ncbi:MAG: phage portal protein [Alphaproteobacteria bacterium]|nr:phage portal protein [Alphaproteobacteria bacterium]
MLAGGREGWGGVPYDAADNYGEHMAAWQSLLWSPDTELNPYRDRIVSRVRDMVRNDGWASGAVTRILDNVVGANFRPISKPDYRTLAHVSGNPAFDAEWANEYKNAVEANWRIWANDPGRYCDTARALNVAQIMRLGFRHELIEGDALARVAWMPERVGKGRARYATAIEVIDPDRLSNPQLRFDQQTMRGGVQVDENGAAVGYWIREAHQGDWFNAAKSVTWEFEPRETEWGRPVIIHHFEHERAAQHRGGAGILTPVLQRLKMLIKYDGTELDAAIINAIFAAYIESPYDPQMVQDALGDSDSVGAYQNMRQDFHHERRITLGGSRVLNLFPGEKMNAVSATRPANNFRDFEGAMLRNVASGIGISAQQLSNDWSDVNYSSARAALLESWKTMTRRRDNFAHGFADPIFCAWLEESMDVDNLPLPAGAPDYADFRGAYARCRWMGPGRGWIDPVDEKAGAILGIDAALSTLEAECAEQGLEVEEVLDQRARELKMFADRGIPLPSWANAEKAMDAARKPDAE